MKKRQLNDIDVHHTYLKSEGNKQEQNSVIFVSLRETIFLKIWHAENVDQFEVNNICEIR